MIWDGGGGQWAQIPTKATRAGHEWDKQCKGPQITCSISPAHDEGDACGQFYTYLAQLLPFDSLPTPELTCVHLTRPLIGH